MTALVVLEYSWDCFIMRAVSGAAIIMEDSYCEDASVDGLVIPRPPSHTGKAISSLVTSLKEYRPVRDVRNFCLIVSSSGCSR